MPELCNKRKNKIEPVGHRGARWSVHSDKGTEPAQKFPLSKCERALLMVPTESEKTPSFWLRNRPS
jgi:hypothetical protein